MLKPIPLPLLNERKVKGIDVNKVFMESAAAYALLVLYIQSLLLTQDLASQVANN